MTSTSDQGYVTSFTDWLACAVGGRHEGATRRALSAAEGAEGMVMAAATAGHVLDYDDTFLPGIAHLSAPTAPVAMVLGAELDVDVATMMDAYEAGFEAMGALARSGHPALYDAGLHPTAVCGAAGAAVVASRLMACDEQCEARAVRLAMLGICGLRASFGSDAKSLQVGFAAASGLRAARLATGGATASADITPALEELYGFAVGEPGISAVGDNWIKAFPCCLQTHSSIEAAAELAAQGVEAGAPVTATVHPVSRQAASYDDVEDGLQAKFSIPYTIAFTLLYGPPRVADFAAVDEQARIASKAVAVVTDADMLESEAVLTGPSSASARVLAATGSPSNPMSPTALKAKVDDLAGNTLDAVLADTSQPAMTVYERSGLR